MANVYISCYLTDWKSSTDQFEKLLGFSLDSWRIIKSLFFILLDTKDYSSPWDSELLSKVRICFKHTEVKVVKTYINKLRILYWFWK
jgi:hypothetical protein